MSHLYLEVAGAVSHLYLEVAGAVSHLYLEVAGAVSHLYLKVVGAVSHLYLEVAGAVSHRRVHGHQVFSKRTEISFLFTVRGIYFNKKSHLLVSKINPLPYSPPPKKNNICSLHFLN